jgi:hypothetical protein
MLTKTQLSIAAKMFDLAAAAYSNNGCNDFELDNTPENLEFMRGMIAASDYPEDEPQISRDGTKIYMMDWAVMRYLVELLESEAKS